MIRYRRNAINDAHHLSAVVAHSGSLTLMVVMMESGSNGISDISISSTISLCHGGTGGDGLDGWSAVQAPA